MSWVSGLAQSLVPSLLQGVASSAMTGQFNLGNFAGATLNGLTGTLLNNGTNLNPWVNSQYATAPFFGVPTNNSGYYYNPTTSGATSYAGTALQKFQQAGVLGQAIQGGTAKSLLGSNWDVTSVDSVPLQTILQANGLDYLLTPQVLYGASNGVTTAGGILTSPETQGLSDMDKLVYWLSNTTTGSYTGGINTALLANPQYLLARVAASATPNVLGTMSGMSSINPQNYWGMYNNNPLTSNASLMGYPDMLAYYNAMQSRGALSNPLMNNSMLNNPLANNGLNSFLSSIGSSYATGGGQGLNIAGNVLNNGVLPSINGAQSNSLFPFMNNGVLQNAALYQQQQLQAPPVGNDAIWQKYFAEAGGSATTPAPKSGMQAMVNSALTRAKAANPAFAQVNDPIALTKIFLQYMQVTNNGTQAGEPLFSEAVWNNKGAANNPVDMIVNYMLALADDGQPEYAAATTGVPGQGGATTRPQVWSLRYDEWKKLYTSKPGCTNCGQQQQGLPQIKTTVTQTTAGYQVQIPPSATPTVINIPIYNNFNPTNTNTFNPSNNQSQTNGNNTVGTTPEEKKNVTPGPTPTERKTEPKPEPKKPEPQTIAFRVYGDPYMDSWDGSSRKLEGGKLEFKGKTAVHLQDGTTLVYITDEAGKKDKNGRELAFTTRVIVIPADKKNIKVIDGLMEHQFKALKNGKYAYVKEAGQIKDPDGDLKVTPFATLEEFKASKYSGDLKVESNVYQGEGSNWYSDAARKSEANTAFFEKNEDASGLEDVANLDVVGAASTVSVDESALKSGNVKIRIGDVTVEINEKESETLVTGKVAPGDAKTDSKTESSEDDIVIDIDDEPASKSSDVDVSIDDEDESAKSSASDKFKDATLVAALDLDKNHTITADELIKKAMSDGKVDLLKGGMTETLYNEFAATYGLTEAFSVVSKGDDLISQQDISDYVGAGIKYKTA
ncbi:MAG: hypothetical protein V4691_04060 [Pseudomonadota bacterium]